MKKKLSKEEKKLKEIKKDVTELLEVLALKDDMKKAFKEEIKAEVLKEVMAAFEELEERLRRGSKISELIDKIREIEGRKMYGRHD
jgi:F0F1-type ATP synthase delta subunit